MAFVITFWEVLGSIVLFVALYGLLLNRLAHASQPVRLLLAEDGERLLRDNGALCKEERDQVNFYLNNMFSVWPTVCAALMIPVAFLCVPFSKRPKAQPHDKSMFRLSMLFTASVFAANPIFGVIAICEFFVLGILLVALTANLSLLRSLLIKILRTEYSLGRPHFHPAH